MHKSVYKLHTALRRPYLPKTGAQGDKVLRYLPEP